MVTTTVASFYRVPLDSRYFRSSCIFRRFYCENTADCVQIPRQAACEVVGMVDFDELSMRMRATERLCEAFHLIYRAN